MRVGPHPHALIPGPSGPVAVLTTGPPGPRCFNELEPTTGIEPVTPSLPRKCSTTEPRGRSERPAARAKPWSGRRDSDPRPSAWKADALPTELLPLMTESRSRPEARTGGAGRIRTSEGARPAGLQPAAFDRFATTPILHEPGDSPIRGPADRLFVRKPGVATSYDSVVGLAKGFEPPTG